MSYFRKAPEEVRREDKIPYRQEEYSEYYKWFNNLKRGVIEGILRHIETDQKRLDILTDDESMKIWAAVFSDPYFTFVSYENDENVGDGVVGGFLPDLAHRQYPHATPDELTNLKNYYTSNIYQGNLMKNYSIRGKPFIETYMLKGSSIRDKSHGYRLTTYIYSDFYEAIYGGLLSAGRRVKAKTLDGVTLSTGLGWEYCERWFNYIFVSGLPEKRLEFKHSKKTADSIFGSLLSKFEYYNPETSMNFKMEKRVERSNPNDKSDTRTFVIISIFWTHGVLSFLKNTKVSKLTNDQVERLPKSSDAVLVKRIQRDTEQEAKLEASERALEALKELGITEKWAEDTKRRLDEEALMKDPVTKDGYTKVLAYCKTKGLTNVRFSSLQKHASKEGRIVALQLIANKGAEIVALQSKIFDQGDVHYCKGALINIFAQTL